MRDRPADTVISEPERPHLLGVEDVAQVDDARLAHHFLEAAGIEAAELVPFGDDHQHVGAKSRGFAPNASRAIVGLRLTQNDAVPRARNTSLEPTAPLGDDPVV